MKRVILFMGILLMTIISSCKKEVIRPNGCEEKEQQEISLRKANKDENSVTSPTGGDITDPNDDDYSSRRPVKKSN